MTLQSLALVNGRAWRRNGRAGEGGAVWVHGQPGSHGGPVGAYFTAVAVTFANNSATDYGGAVKADSYSSLFLRGCRFTGNSVGAKPTKTSRGTRGLGGALYAGAGAKEQQACVTVVDSVFQNNQATFGGAVAISGSKKGRQVRTSLCPMHPNRPSWIHGLRLGWVLGLGFKPS